MAEESVGDSSRDVLAGVQSSAKHLLKTVLNCRAGAIKCNREDTPYALLKRRQQLLLQCASCAAELELRSSLAQEPLPIHHHENSSLEALHRSIAQAKEELVQLKSHYQLDCLLLQCLQTGECLLTKLFPVSSDKELGDGVDKQTELARRVLRDCDHLDQLRGDMVSLQRERAASQQACRALHSRLSQLQEAQESHRVADDSEIEAELGRVRSEVFLLRGALRCLVAASGVDWSEDEQLLQVMTQTDSAR